MRKISLMVIFALIATSQSCEKLISTHTSSPITAEGPAACQKFTSALTRTTCLTDESKIETVWSASFDSDQFGCNFTSSKEIMVCDGECGEELSTLSQIGGVSCEEGTVTCSLVHVVHDCDVKPGEWKIVNPCDDGDDSKYTRQRACVDCNGQEVDPSFCTDLLSEELLCSVDDTEDSSAEVINKEDSSLSSTPGESESNDGSTYDSGVEILEDHQLVQLPSNSNDVSDTGVTILEESSIWGSREQWGTYEDGSTSGEYDGSGSGSGFYSGSGAYSGSGSGYGSGSGSGSGSGFGSGIVFGSGTSSREGYDIDGLPFNDGIERFIVNPNEPELTTTANINVEAVKETEGQGLTTPQMVAAIAVSSGAGVAFLGFFGYIFRDKIMQVFKGNIVAPDQGGLPI